MTIDDIKYILEKHEFNDEIIFEFVDKYAKNIIGKVSYDKFDSISRIIKREKLDIWKCTSIFIRGKVENIENLIKLLK